MVKRCPDKSTAAVGYTNGDVKVINYIQKTIITTLRGHRSGISCLGFSDEFNPHTKNSGNSNSNSNTTSKQNYSLMASGGLDNDINVWDLVGYSGVCKLRGHKDTITGVTFVRVPGVCSSSNSGSGVTESNINSNSNSNDLTRLLLISVSKDSLMKVWDMTTFNCIQTIVGHRSEIYSVLAITMCSHAHAGVNYLAKGDSDGADGLDGEQLVEEVRVFTGAADEYIRCYKLITSSSSSTNSSKDQDVSLDTNTNSNETSENETNDGDAVLQYYGSIFRGGGVASSNILDKCVGIHINTTNTMLAVQSAGKLVEFYYIRNKEEVKKKYKRRCKRLREKQASDSKGINVGGSIEKEGYGVNSIWESGSTLVDNIAISNEEKFQNSMEMQVSDEIDYIGNIRTTHKVKGFSFNPHCSISSTVSTSSTTKAATNTGDSDDEDQAQGKKKKSRKEETKKYTSVTLTTTLEHVLLSLNNNTIIYYDVSFKQRQQQIAGGSTSFPSLVPEDFQPVKLSALELPGHRSDIRAVCVSSDTNTLVTCSSEEVKCWNRKSFTCVQTCPMEYYALCIALVPGDKYALVGTKEGHLLVSEVNKCVVSVRFCMFNRVVYILYYYDCTALHCTALYCTARWRTEVCWTLIYVDLYICS